MSQPEKAGDLTINTAIAAPAAAHVNPTPAAESQMVFFAQRSSLLGWDKNLRIVESS